MKEFVALAAFPKSGITYLINLLYYVLFEQKSVSSVTERNFIEKSFIIDVQAYPNTTPREEQGCRFIKSHLPYTCSDKFYAISKKAILLVRDPIDVMFSAYDYLHLIDTSYQRDFDAFVYEWVKQGGGCRELDFAGSWLGHLKSWTEQERIPIIIIKYLDLVDQGADTIKNVLEFCGIEASQYAIDRAVSMCTMQEMRKREDEVTAGELAAGGLGRRRKGRHFVNKSYRNMSQKVYGFQSRAAAERFGEAIRRYLS